MRQSGSKYYLFMSSHGFYTILINMSRTVYIGLLLIGGMNIKSLYICLCRYKVFSKSSCYISNISINSLTTNLRSSVSLWTTHMGLKNSHLEIPVHTWAYLCGTRVTTSPRILLVLNQGSLPAAHMTFPVPSGPEKRTESGRVLQGLTKARKPWMYFIQMC